MGRCWVDLVCMTFLLIFALFIPVHCNDPVKEAYTIDTLVVMDTPGFSAWVKRQDPGLTQAEKETKAREQIKEYISLVIRQANVRLESLDTDNVDWTVQLSIAGFSINTDPLSGSANRLTNTISYQSALTTFQIWMVANGYQNTYDYAILLTGYDLKGDSTLPYEIKGIANIGAVCNTDGTSITVVEDRGGFQSAHFVAHEFGHSLGSKHDGEDPNTDCPESDRYLMAINETEVTSSNRYNPWFFSSCSKRSIVNHISTDVLLNHSDCLKTSLPAVQEFKDTENVLPGQVYDIKAQCQQLYGPRSTVCSGEQFKLDDVCTSMPCLDTSNESGGLRCLLHRAAEGSSCGTQKICQMGRCVQSALAPSTVFTDCYFGDATVTIQGYSCNQFTSANLFVCYQPNIRSACCESCTNLASQSPACPYGDRKDGCSEDGCKQIRPDGTRYDEDCCLTCKYDVAETCVDVLDILGMTCAEKANRDQGCYDMRVAYQCCKTCSNLRKNITDCEYGDKTPGAVCEGLATSEAACKQHGSQCCQTCSKLSGNTARTEHGSKSDLLLAVPILLAIARVLTEPNV